MKTKRNKIAPQIDKNLSHYFADWAKDIASMRYPPKFTKTYSEVRVSFGKKRLRVDFVGVVRWSNKRPKDIFIGEIKSCLQDFQSYDKWRNYLNFCNYFCFAIPKGDRELLDALEQEITESETEDVGILLIDVDSKFLNISIHKYPQKLQPTLTHKIYETLYEREI